MKLGHTWHEGLQTCKTRGRLESVVEKHIQDVAQQARNGSVGGADDANFEAVATATALGFTTTLIPGTLPILSSAHQSSKTPTTHAAVTLNSKATITATTKMLSIPANISIPTPTFATAGIPHATTAHITVRHSPSNMSKIVSVTSEACKRFLLSTISVSIPLALLLLTIIY